ncbi:MAG: hypothetical protein Kow00105_05640 [Phycisphaeraceae bacterium]
MLIDRCVCTNREFADLLHLAQRKGLDLQGLSACTGAGEQCRRCRPYLKLVLDIEQTEFGYLIDDHQSMSRNNHCE